MLLDYIKDNYLILHNKNYLKLKPEILNASQKIELKTVYENNNDIFI